MLNVETWAKRTAAVKKESEESGKTHEQWMKVLHELKYKVVLRNVRIKEQKQASWGKITHMSGLETIKEEEGNYDPGASGYDAYEATSSKAGEAPESRKVADPQDQDHINDKLADPQDIMDEITDMTGLEAVTFHMAQVKSFVETARRQKVDLTEERFHTLFIGNPGTGKTRVAELYSEFLTSLGLVNAVTEITTGASLVYNGISEVQFLLDSINEHGIIVINDAHQLRPAQNATGRDTIDYILAEMDRLKGQVIFVFTAHKGKDIESLLGHNPSLRSQLPYVNFDD